MLIAWAGSIVTKTLLFHTYCSCAGSVTRSCTHNHTIYQVCSHNNQFTCFSTVLISMWTVVKTQEWPPLWEHCYSNPGVWSWKTSVIIVWCMCSHRQTMWRYRLWLWGPGLGKDPYIKWKIYVRGRQLLAM
jgi:hypothetical protein